MFDQLELAAADPILGLSEAFQSDPNPEKINLVVGVFRDGSGKTPVLECVQRVRARIVERETSKDYLPIAGPAEFARLAQELVFGPASRLLAAKRVATAQTLGGTGALRVAAELIAQTSPASRVWLSDPTWPNHANVFRAAGLETRSYPYFDARHHRLDWSAFEAALKDVSAADVVVLHGCCHNPTGADLDLAQWRRVAEIARERGFLPLLDFAYQGFAKGVEEDAAGVRAICDAVPEALVASSLSKNFGLYNERVGALHVAVPSAERAQVAASQLKRLIRANYSNPPAHGGAIVAAVLGDPALRELWVREVDAMRARIRAVRERFTAALEKRRVGRDFSFIAQQQGMFSFTGLSREQVLALRERFAIYAVDSGRINVAGIRDGDLERLADAVAAVIAA